jgi:hypothetical protein
VAVVMLLLVGPLGLAISYSFMAWFGVVCLLRPMGSVPKPLFSITRVLLLRSSLFVSLIFVATFLHWAHGRLGAVTVLHLSMLTISTIIVSAAVEPTVRRFLFARKSSGD